jgi:hypothetical protein
MAYSSDTDLEAYIPDILSFGITSFTAEHDKAESDINRKLKVDWYRTTGLSGDFTSSKLQSAQLLRASVYCTLGFYVFPQLTKWGEDKFEKQMKYYQTEYEKEIVNVIEDGVQYDIDGDSSISSSETIHKQNRLIR